jgi:predicted flap endonuclease-1-like 5' DNA nuclease
MTALVNIEGVGKVYAQKLKHAGVTSTNSLLVKGATPKGRKEIAQKSGISQKLILEWVNRVDLFRIKGVAEEYSDLLENAGVDTVVELAKRKADKLHEKLIEVNQRKRLVRQLPPLVQVRNWIRQAGRLPRVVKY